MEANTSRSEKAHTTIHLVALCCIAVGLVFGKAILSISLLVGLINLIILSDFRHYWTVIKTNHFLHLLLAYFLFHFVTLLWSEDVAYGVHDTKVRISLLLLALLFLLKQPSRQQLVIIAWIFILSLLVATIYNFGHYHGWMTTAVYDDIRGMSHFGSHIRFALLVVTGILLSIYLMSSLKKSRFFLIPIVLWFIYYTYYSQVVSGYITLIGLLSFLLLVWTWKKNKWTAIGLLVIEMLAVILLLTELFKPISFDREKYKDLPAFTKEGNPYYHNPVNVLPETGEPIEIMICWDELEREWNAISEIPFRDGRDLRGQLIQTTLIRYLASKQLTKDAEGVRQLNHNDVENIEKGNASIHQKGMLARWYGIQYQLNNQTDPNGHSLLERIEFWKHGLHIAKQNALIGTGIGDVQLAFNRSYEQGQTKLVPERRNRAHNMILTTLITMGVFGLFLFLWFHAYFIHQAVTAHNIYAIGFVIILLLSYLTEDTLETQIGVSFAGFFLGYFYVLFQKNSTNTHADPIH